MKLDEIIRTGLSRVDTIRVVRTAINPLLWLVGLTTPIAFVLIAVIGDQMIRLALLCFAAVPVLVTLVAYLVSCSATLIACSRRNIELGSKRFGYFTKRVGIPKLWISRTRSFESRPRTLGPTVERTNEDSSSGL
jgi:hypothetical protein